MIRFAELACIVTVIAAATPALADASGADASDDGGSAVLADAVIRDARALPSFATLDRTDRTTRLDVDLAYTSMDLQDFHAAVRANLYGQVVAKQGYGGYVSLPFSYLSGGDDSAKAMGDLELGGSYHFGTAARGLALRGGFLLPTASDDLEGSVTNFVNQTARLTDITASAPNITWLRLAASPMIRSGKLFARADVGLDVPVHNSGDGMDPDAIGRLNLGIGYDTDTVALMGEFVTVATLASDPSERFLHTAAATARLHTGRVAPSLSLVLPLDSAIRSGVNFSVIAGIDVTGF